MAAVTSPQRTEEEEEEDDPSTEDTSGGSIRRCLQLPDVLDLLHLSATPKVKAIPIRNAPTVPDSNGD